MDNLSCSYTGNKLNSVTDNSGNYGGYPETSGNLFTYDDNGNMKSHVDRGILQIDYNHLNLPSYLKFDKEYYSHDSWDIAYNENTKYMYRADGVKLKKIHTYGSGRTSIETTRKTEYFDGFQYEEDVLQFVPTSEGYYDFVQNKYIYQYKDQVGNIRLAYYKGSSGTAQIDRTTNYYPFGLEFGGELNIGYSISPNYAYSTQGQERQRDTGWSSFKWRNYDPAMARFFNVDPLSEKYAYQSHYNFSENKVIAYMELEGLEAIDANKVREAFDTGKKGKSYQMVIHVDQPGDGGDRDVYQILPKRDSGHAFITLTRKNTDGTVDSKTFGFYPYPPGVSPVSSNASGKIKDNEGHEQEVVQTRGISEKDFNDVLDFVESDKNTTYDLNINNCADFVINAAAAGGVNLPKTSSSYGGFSGHNPGDLGEDLRQQNNNIRKGKTPEGNSKTPKSKNNESDNDRIKGIGL
ncbi:RHS repeat-associated core domain-containing protein [Chryseobacterium kwangjuense]|uniref:RHS repeat-associated core domain-containing protein n=1 Tax=Chryseobacterium kwangjuense TaxID=267125 RepID=A0ABW9K672_9FLAO